MSIRFGFSGSSFDDVDAVIAAAQGAEAAGFEVFTLPDLPGALSPLITLAAVAHATSVIKISTFVLNTGLWNPATISRELATLDRVSGGRLEIVLGSGIPQPSLQGVIPPDSDARFTRLQATIDAIEAAAESPGITPGFTGRLPVLVAGTGERTLRLAAARADGFFIASVPPVPRVQLPQGHLVLPELSATEAFLARLRGYAGERADRLELGTSTEVVLTDDAPTTAIELTRIHTYLTPEQLRASPKIAVGTPEEIASQLTERADRLGLTYQMLRGQAPEKLAGIITKVRSG